MYNPERDRERERERERERLLQSGNKVTRSPPRERARSRLARETLARTVPSSTRRAIIAGDGIFGRRPTLRLLLPLAFSQTRALALFFSRRLPPPADTPALACAPLLLATLRSLPPLLPALPSSSPASCRNAIKLLDARRANRETSLNRDGYRQCVSRVAL